MMSFLSFTQTGVGVEMDVGGRRRREKKRGVLERAFYIIMIEWRRREVGRRGRGKREGRGNSHEKRKDKC